MFNRIKSKFLAVCVAGAAALTVVSSPVMAADAKGPDYSQVTSSVDFAEVMVGIMAIAVAIAGLYVCINGVKKLTGFLRSA
ncbi:hypothetical protein [Morganella sp. EGD-HP17]|uniref:hypothetical protein n=1 Tax=Morganella sp. EGD-HP17 TaxID=1435146 RepID=UPI0003FBB399|nr:hypothetical protein [Morganella sp. EGD-HP17]ETO41236.1 hypothetical protein X965_11200 [Morganella sp. EGD-HP17]